MSSIQYKKHRVFRETPDIVFYDISVDDSNASDFVVHGGSAISPSVNILWFSPPEDIIGDKQFYTRTHYNQVDYNRVLSGERTFNLVNFDWI